VPYAFISGNLINFTDYVVLIRWLCSCFISNKNVYYFSNVI